LAEVVAVVEEEAAAPAAKAFPKYFYKLNSRTCEASGGLTQVLSRTHDLLESVTRAYVGRYATSSLRWATTLRWDPLAYDVFTEDEIHKVLM
jgi:hypothetical protein